MRQLHTESKHSKAILCGAVLFAVGGAAYNVIELLWRGRTHYSMFLLGGSCFHLIGRVYTRLSGCCLAVRCLVSAAGVTAAELLCGIVVNLRCRLQVWDYSAQPFNLCGQICLLYSMLWGILSIPSGYLYKQLRKYLLSRL